MQQPSHTSGWPMAASVMRTSCSSGIHGLAWGCPRAARSHRISDRESTTMLSFTRR
ncbi:hypothetical protein BC831DRAFT_452718, partial [Entophlyctis helioformis]